MEPEKPDHETETRAKYSQGEVDALGAKGHAFKNPDGSYSYPIDDLEDLRNAIHAVGRGNADHDALRKYIIGRAGALSATDEIPENWGPDGSLKDADAKSRRNPALPGRPTVPGELRTARDEMRGVREVRKATGGIEMREVANGHGGSDLICSGYASVTCANQDDRSNAYEMEDMWGPYTESTVRGFVQKSIGEGCDTVFWPNHGDGALPMARTKAGNLRLSEDLTGLHYEARLNPARADVQILRAAIEDGTITESSFAFRVMRQQWNEDYTERWILEASLDRGDVSPVTFGANPSTGDYPLTMRSAMSILTSCGLDYRAFLSALKEIRAGAAISQATRDVLQPILNHLAAIDEMVDVDQPELAELLGVANPDADDQEQEGAAAPDETRAATVAPLILPDYGAEARQKLARMRGRS